jgi:leucyl aminopeptidase (aminopeptidase T)
LEDETQGSVWLPKAGPATDAVLHFQGGRIVRIEAARGADALARWLDSHTGEPRRVSHIGIGLNPYLERPPIGWTFLDEKAHGNLYVALGENRFMGGQNESSLNVDYNIPNATLMVEDRFIVSQGKVAV